MKKTLFILNKIIDISGWVCVIALLLMVANVFIDVFVRYVLVGVLKYLDLYLWYNEHLSWLGGIGMQELEWHWFSVLFLLGLGYTLRENGHVRVDIFYDNFSRRTQAIINIAGTFIFNLPFCMVMIYFCWEFFIDSYNSGENRGDPGSLPRLWPIKFVLPFSFAFLILSAMTVVLTEIQQLSTLNKEATK